VGGLGHGSRAEKEWVLRKDPGGHSKTDYCKAGAIREGRDYWKDRKGEGGMILEHVQTKKNTKGDGFTESKLTLDEGE